MRNIQMLLANLACLMFAASPETIGQPVQNPIPPNFNPEPPMKPGENGPVQATWGDAGQTLAQSLIAAEQGVVIADQNVQATKISGLLALCNLDETGRAQYIGGVSAALHVKDGDKLLKGHANYLTEMRRVSGAIKNNVNPGDIVKVLEGPGLYREKIQKIPAQSAAGGQNRGTGASSVQAKVTELVKEHGAENVQVTVKGQEQKAPETATPTEHPSQTPSQSQPATILSEPPKTDTAPQRHQQNAEVSTAQAAGMVSVLHENQIEPVAFALAKRCSLSNSPLFQELGKTIQRILDNAASQDAINEPAKVAANG